MGFFIYSELNLGVPNSLDDILTGMEKVLPKSTVVLVKEMKGLRNILIHRYGEIDDTIVFVQISEHLEDFEKVMDGISKFLQKKDKQKK